MSANTSANHNSNKQPLDGICDKNVFAMNGFVGLFISLGIIVYGLFSLGSFGPNLVAIGMIFGGIILLSGLVVVQPQEARVIQFLGQYLGTLKETGFFLVPPMTTKMTVSLRLRNFESPKLKVNEAEGNPIEIGVIIVWRVIDAAQAMFNVERLSQFVEKQSESALRMLATKYPYDKRDHSTISLHENLDEVNEQLCKMVIASMQNVGVEILEARISHLAYAAEIAAAMLQRQQAQAIISARQKIVEGAVGMVNSAIQMLEKDGVVKLDNDRKAAMVSNLLVVLCSERPSQPVINASINA